MSTNNQTNHYALILIAFLGLLFIETLIFENGSIVVVVAGIALLYFGMRRNNRVLFWIGLILLFISVFSMITIRLLLFGVVLYILYKLWKQQPLPTWERIQFPESSTGSHVIQQRLFSSQTTPTEPYAWQDVHVHSIFGEYGIDLTNTILPKGTSFISIRKGIGKTVILVPYGINVRIHYSTFVGEACFFDAPPVRLWNQTYQLADQPSTDPDTPVLVISLSSWIGDVEVLRK